jgi:hypothetical protein
LTFLNSAMRVAGVKPLRVRATSQQVLVLVHRTRAHRRLSWYIHSRPLRQHVGIEQQHRIDELRLDTRPQSFSLARHCDCAATEESDDVGKSLSQDRRKNAKTKVKSGQGDKGDR